MTIVFNLLCKAFIAILDILLLDFYLKNLYKDIYQKKLKWYYMYLYISFMLLLLLIVNNDFILLLINLITFIIAFILLYISHIPIIEILKKLLIFYLIKLIMHHITIAALSWLFSTKISIEYLNYAVPYTIISNFTERYLVYLILIIMLKRITFREFKIFKTISLFLFISFTIVFIFKNTTLFLIPAIARTYIFTVMISIIALICFDRMQTKYEKDKHLQESIIQNLEKEKEFNQQREQQQKEIRKINHNLNNILIILQSHLEKEEYEEAKNYIEQNLKTHVKAYQALTHTGIAAIDGALNAHIQSIKEKGIQYDENISKILHLGSIVPGDLALIISLALDNAKEACENIDGEKHISLKLQSKQTHVILYIENSIPEGSHPTFHKTSKKDKIAHGFGVSSIKEMAERYHGEAKYEVKHDQVILRVVLQK